MNSQNLSSFFSSGLTYPLRNDQKTFESKSKIEPLKFRKTGGQSLSSNSFSGLFSHDSGTYSVASYGHHTMTLGAQGFTPLPIHADGDFFANKHSSDQAIFSTKQKSPTIETDDADDEEELGHAETYADYMPSKLKIGERHPDPVVETSSLSSVSPPDVWYQLSIPAKTIDSGSLSALQLEAITYACQQHETILPNGARAGFLIGDGAGVGKGRTVAGIIFENYVKGRKKAIWLSVSSDLKYDAERDLKDIGAGEVNVHSLNKFKYADISSKVNGNVKKGVIFATYASLISESQSKNIKFKTRLDQLIQWCGEEFDGVIVLDECHRAKNLCPVTSSKSTKTGVKVLDLQNRLPKARVVYASATGASEPKNMAYMTRLGLWDEGTPFKEFSDFVSVVERRGIGAMELVAMDMKLRGLYIARQLSFAGVSFKVEEIPLTDEFVKMYNEAVKLWVDARDKFSEALEMMEPDSRSKKTVWCQFWSCHQRFFKYLCVAAKVGHVVQLTRDAVRDGKSVVIGLQSTGEARTLERLGEQDGELTDFVSSAKGVFQSLVERHFPAPDKKKCSKFQGKETTWKLENDSELSDSSSSSSSVQIWANKEGKEPSRRSPRNFRERKTYEEIVLSDDSNEAHSFTRENNSPQPFDEDVDESSNLSTTDSEQESDFNPFGERSDSDDPWASRRDRGTKRKRKTKEGSVGPKTGASVSLTPVDKATALKEELLSKLNRMSDSLPPNTLDFIIDELGGPDNVAEMTGRKGRVVGSDGSAHYESRSTNDCALEKLNMIEKQRFMDGEKRIAIISEAASSGISLHSDRRAKNQTRRVHVTLELPWSAERAVQQFGRTHRSNQVSAPEYLFLISNLAGERRFASVVAKRLECLGALTHGDRRATETRDLSMFNFDTKYGRLALETVLLTIVGQKAPLISPPSEYDGDFLVDARNALCGVGIFNKDPCTSHLVLDKDCNKIDRFLNRILGIEVHLQNALFEYFTDTLAAVIDRVKKTGRYDLGILDLGAVEDRVKRVKCQTFLTQHASGTTKTELHTVLVDRGLTWESAASKWEELVDKDEGFYLSSHTRNGKMTAVLVVLDESYTQATGKKRPEKVFRIYRPNTGLQVRRESLSELKSKYRKASKTEVEAHWRQNYVASESQCSHLYWYGQCRRRLADVNCEVGLRQRTYHVLSGSVLAVWMDIEGLLTGNMGRDARLQVVRLKTQDGVRIVGCLIPQYAVQDVIVVLGRGKSDSDEEKRNASMVNKLL